MLTALGATETEDSVYCFVATTVSATWAEIRSATGLSAGEVRGALAGLHRRGLVSQTGDDPVRYVASSAGTVAAMISNRLRELREAQEVLDLLADKRHAAQLSGQAAGIFEVVHGQQALRHHVLHLLHTARSEVVNMVKPPVIAVQPSERARPGDTARNRVIFETGALEAPGALDAIRDGMTSASEVRVHTKLPVKMLAIDRCAALVPLTRDDTTPAGVLIYPSAVLDALLALFEHVWDSAVALHMAGAGAVSGAAAGRAVHRGQPAVVAAAGRADRRGDSRPLPGQRPDRAAQGARADGDGQRAHAHAAGLGGGPAGLAAGADGRPVARSADTVAGVRRQAVEGCRRHVAARAASVIARRSG
jgi:hypothetical protein